MAKRILICGLSRSGTSFLYTALSNALPSATTFDREISALMVEDESETVFTKRPLDCFRIDDIRKKFAEDDLRIIFCVRDPRDTICSVHESVPHDYFIGFKKQYFVDAARDIATLNNPGLGPIYDAWKKVQGGADVFTLRYDDLVRDTAKSVGEIADFIDEEVDTRDFEVDETSATPEHIRVALNGLRPLDDQSLGVWKKHPLRIWNEFSQNPGLHKIMKDWGYAEDDGWFKERFRKRLTTTQPAKPKKRAPPKKLSLVTVCTDAYDMVYPQKLHRNFEQKSGLTVDHYCITDRPEQVGDWATPLAPFKSAKGWWNKLNLFSPDMPEGVILYMDIDIVMVNSFDEEIEAMLARPEPMRCVSDAIGWKGEKFSSSMMCFDSGAFAPIFERFEKAGPALETSEGGDQVWVGPQLGDVYYVDDDYPDLKKNLKFHLAKRDGKKLHLPGKLPNTVKLVDCGGQPKPHDLASVPYIKANWHDVPQG